MRALLTLLLMLQLLLSGVVMRHAHGASGVAQPTERVDRPHVHVRGEGHGHHHPASPGHSHGHGHAEQDADSLDGRLPTDQGHDQDAVYVSDETLAAPPAQVATPRSSESRELIPPAPVRLGVDRADLVLAAGTGPPRRPCIPRALRPHLLRI